jgi:hypothetical protein
MRHFFILYFSVFFGVLCFSQGEKGNANMNNSTPELIEINTRNNFNSISNQPIINYLDTVQSTIFEDRDVELKEVQTSSIKNKATKKRSNSPDIVKEKSERSDDEITSLTMFKLNQVQVASRSQSTQRSPTAQQQLQIDLLVNELENQDSASFDYHLNKFVAGNYNLERKHHLQKAKQISPDDARILKQLTAVALIESDSLDLLGYLEDQVESGVLSSEYIEYGSDLLLSAPENSTLITHSFEDTYATLYNQLKFKKNTDITVINLDFLQSVAYRKNLHRLNYIIPEESVVNTQFLTRFCALNSAKQIALSMTLPSDYFLPLQAFLFIQGIVFEYNPITNLMDRNQSLFEEKLSKKVIFQNSIISNKLASNYIPMLLQVEADYQSNGDMEKVKAVNSMIDEIARKSPQKKIIQELKKN